MNKHTSKLRTFVGIALISSALILMLILNFNSLGARQQQYTGNENHVITLDQAVKYVQNFANNPSTPNIRGAYFGKNIFDKILSQNGCVGLRYYYAKKDDGTATLVLVGVDSLGNDMTQGILAEESIPCPPFCPAPNPLYK